MKFYGGDPCEGGHTNFSGDPDHNLVLAEICTLRLLQLVSEFVPF